MMVRVVTMTLRKCLRMLRLSMARKFKAISPLIAVDTQLFPIVVTWDTFIPNSLFYRGMTALRS